MTLKESIKNDWALIDGIVEVTLLRKHPTAADVTGVKALKRELTAGQLAYLGGSLGISETTCYWHLWESPALLDANAKVGVGDEFLDADGTTWKINQRTYSDQTSRYRCLCTPNL